MTLERMFVGFQTKYTVPDYQRDYSWKSEQVEELWSDIITSRQNETEYFMGTIVLNSEDSEDQYEIVDGQQRLSTFTLLFSVIASIGGCFSDNHKIFPVVERDDDSTKLAKRIEAMSRERLVHTSEPDNYYLTINRKDRNTFDTQVRSLDSVLVEDSDLKIKPNESRVIKTKKILYKLIWDEFKNNPEALNELYKTLIHFVKRLKFIRIVVTNDYDAFLLFESLNSKGMDLSIADLVKNKLLMYGGKDNEIITKLLDNWDSMISLLDKSRISSVDYLRIYWMTFPGAGITKKELYKHIKTHLQENDPLVFVESLNRKAELFYEFTDKDLTWPSGQHQSQPYLQKISEINTLKYTLCLPVLLYASFHTKGILEELAQISLSYLFRWVTIGDFSVGKANETFNKVLKLLKDGETKKSIVFEPFKNDYHRINDEEFIKSFKSFRTKDNYVAKYILGKIHAHTQNNECIPDFNKIHLEHVLPQQTKLWMEGEEIFSPTAGTVLDDWVYQLGNMTLLNSKLNQKIGNSVFSKKVEKYKDSPFYMTGDIYKKFKNNKYQWSSEVIIKRADAWATLAVNIWPLKFD